MYLHAHMLLSPTLSGAEEFAHTHMHSMDDVLIVIGCCDVEYVGQARSKLGCGECIIIVSLMACLCIRWLVVSL